MKRSALCLIASLIVAASLAAPALAEGNVNFVLGGRTMTDDAFWNDPGSRDFRSQGLFGVNVDFGRASWPIHIEAGVEGSARRETISGNDVTAGATDGFVGVNKTFKILGKRIRPYVGGGFASVEARIESNGISENSSSGGFYVHGGVLWRIGRRFNIGVDVRGTGGTKMTILGRDFNANSRQGGLVLGWGWPRS